MGGLKIDGESRGVEAIHVVAEAGCAASTGYDGTSRACHSSEGFALQVAEMLLAVTAEDLADREPLPLLYVIVEVDKRPPEPTGQGASQRCLAAAHVSDEEDSVSVHSLWDLV